MKDNVVAQWIVLGLSVVAFILLFKFLVTYLPQQGIFGGMRNVILSI